VHIEMDEEERSALHKDIFGDESGEEDEVEEEPVVQEDERINRILATDTSSKRAGGKGAGAVAGKRKAASGGKAITKTRKRLKKRAEHRGEASDSGINEDGDARAGRGAPSDGEGEGESEGRGEGRGEEGEEGEGGGEEGEEGEEGVDGLEAIEEGGRNDFDALLGKIKGRRGGYVRSQEDKASEVLEMQERMEQAFRDDNDAIKADPPMPAVHKVALIGEVAIFLQKRHLHESMMDRGMLSTIADWLKPMEGALVNLEVRSKLLEALALFDVDETTLGSLRSSGIGKYVKMLSLHKRETPKNKRRATALIEKWMRPIYQSSTTYSAADVQVALPRQNAEEMVSTLDAEQSLDDLITRQAHAEDEPAIGRKTKGGARVPKQIGMDFQLQPASSAQPLPSNKYHKESTKGKLQEKLFGKSRMKAGLPQAVKLSVEGRTLDRF